MAFLPTHLFKKSPRQERSMYKHEFHTYRDWGIILSFVCIGIIGIALFHLTLFFDITAGFDAPDLVPPTSGSRTVNRAQLKSAVDIVDLRAATFTRMRSATSTLVDPSR